MARPGFWSAGPIEIKRPSSRVNGVWVPRPASTVISSPKALSTSARLSSSMSSHFRRSRAVRNTPERKRFVILGVVPRPNWVLVVQAECDDNRRPRWEGEFRRLIGSFKLEKGE